MYGEYISLHLELTYHILYYIEHSDVLKGQIKIRYIRGIRVSQ